MGNNQISDTKNMSSIKRLADQLEECNSNVVYNEIRLANMIKAINTLKTVNRSDYEKSTTIELLRSISCMSVFCKTSEGKDAIIQQDLHSIFSDIVVTQLKNHKINCQVLQPLYNILINLTNSSIKMAIQNQKYEFFQTTMNLLFHLSADISHTTYDQDSIILYNHSVRFLYTNARYRDMRKYLIKDGTTQCLSKELDQLKELKVSKSQFKIAMLDITSTLSYLSSDEELDTSTLSNDIVNHFIIVLNECINNSKANLFQNGTKNYIQYTIGTSDFYLYASDYLDNIRSIAVNDTIKQKLFEKDILNVIKGLLINANENEMRICMELLCSLCFHESVVYYLRTNKGLQNAIENIKVTTKDSRTKDSCDQIERMLVTTLSLPIQRTFETRQTVKRKGHIMISYNHKNKDECLIINNELKKRGYKTWMTVHSTFGDLQKKMAEAIENASVLLVCHSYEYKMSNYCRLEAQYAFQLNKNMIAVKLEDNYDADGWLEIILASKSCVDFSKDINSVSRFNELFKQLDVLLDNKNNQEVKTLIEDKIQKAVIVDDTLNDPVAQKETNSQNWLDFCCCCMNRKV